MRGMPGQRGPRGQAVTEFALVLPVMLLILLLTVDFGRLFFSYIAVTNAAREATYHAALRAGDTSFDPQDYKDGVTAAAVRETNVQAQGGAGSLTVSDPTCYLLGSSTIIDCRAASNFAPGIGNQVTVSVAQPFTFLTPLISGVFGGSLTLSASATAPVLNPLDASIMAASAPTSTPTPTPAPTRLRRPSPSRHPPDTGARRDADTRAHAGADTDADTDPDVQGAELLSHVLERHRLADGLA